MFQIDVLSNSPMALSSEKLHFRCPATTLLLEHKLVLCEPEIIKEEGEEEEEAVTRVGTLLAEPLILKEQSNEEKLVCKPVKHSSFSKARTRESLLAEAWERKRGHKIGLHKSVDRTSLHNINTDKSSSAKEKRMPRSASYCGQAIMGSPAGSGSSRSLSKSLTDDDFEELKGCIDLGFGFHESSIPELCHILPALQACYAVTHQSFHEPSEGTSPSPPPSTPSWKITNPGDNPEDVKERLRHWAQAVACNLRLCYEDR